ncbi:tRNA 2-selenouridine(34) synthase MnmH [soil metagenome]
MAELDIEQFLNYSDLFPIIDVRSPGEYQAGHISGSCNVPLFNDEERALIGTCYKLQRRKTAISYGLDMVGPKLSEFVNSAEKIAKDNTVLVHCWRGGMRSGSFSWLVNIAGLKSYILKKGYKAYRNYSLNFLGNLNNLVLLGGETGSGKTEMLQKLKEAGEQVIDLENLACHKGSSFGSLPGIQQPTTEQFQNDLFEQLRKMNHTRRIWMEDESHNIGKVFLPDNLWWKMRASPVIRLLRSKEKRVQNLINNYGNLDYDSLKKSIERISKRLGGLNTSLAIQCLENKDLYQVASLCLNYYDKAYNSGLRHRKQSLILNLDADHQDSQILIRDTLYMADTYTRKVVV